MSLKATEYSNGCLSLLHKSLEFISDKMYLFDKPLQCCKSTVIKKNVGWKLLYI